MPKPPLHHKLSQTRPVWEPFSSDWRQVAMASRVRLARNLSGVAFPQKADAEALLRVEGMLRGRLLAAGAFRGGLSGRVDDLLPFEREMLVERRLISLELARGGVGRAFAVGRTHHVTAMVNEEDHLRVQALLPGLDLKRAWTLAAAALAQVDDGRGFAFHSRLGYLTSNPGSVGTGLRASVMLHLPGLALRGCMGQVEQGLRRVGLSIGGAFGDGTEARADLYLVANLSTLGEDESAILAGLTDTVQELVRHEIAARLAIVRRETALLYDHIGRAYGILRFSRLLTEEEALGGVSALACGLRTGILPGLDVVALNRLILDIQPGHLQYRLAGAVEPAARDMVRSQIVRAELGDPGC
jgi:protein arginine kinase